MNSLENYVVTSLLPDSLKKDPFIVALAEAAEIELKEAYREAKIIANLHEIDKLPEFLLDFLAHEKHVDFYDNTLPIDKKRELIKNSPMLHRKKGTPWAVEQAVSTIFGDANVEEWYEFDGQPFHFAVELKPVGNFKNADMARMLVLAYKNKRSRFDDFVILLMDEDILLLNDTYFYPVFYKTCGEFGGEKGADQHEAGNITIADKGYGYSVKYPVSTKLAMQLDLGSAFLTNDTYSYPQPYGITGEMETLDKFVSTNRAETEIAGEIYSFNVSYPICGEFYAEGE